MTTYYGGKFSRVAHDNMLYEYEADDGSIVSLHILPATLLHIHELMDIMDFIDKRTEGSEEPFAIDQLYALTADVMSNNMELKAVTVDWLNAIGFSVMDVAQFASAMTEFMLRVIEAGDVAKNLQCPGIPTKETDN